MTVERIPTSTTSPSCSAYRPPPYVPGTNPHGTITRAADTSNAVRRRHATCGPCRGARPGPRRRSSAGADRVVRGRGSKLPSLSAAPAGQRPARQLSGSAVPIRAMGQGSTRAMISTAASSAALGCLA